MISTSSTQVSKVSNLYFLLGDKFKWFWAPRISGHHLANGMVFFEHQAIDFGT
jgi:hypothetical protein